MKQQIALFPETPLEFECDFLNGFADSSYHEIDMCVKIGNLLLGVEVKGVNIWISEYLSKLVVVSKNIDQLDHLHKKLELLNILTANNFIEHPFFKDVKKNQRGGCGE